MAWPLPNKPALAQDIRNLIASTIDQPSKSNTGTKARVSAAPAPQCAVGVTSTEMTPHRSAVAATLSS